MEDIYDKAKKPNRREDEVDVEFYTHIYPVLLATYTMSWTNNKALEGHGTCPLSFPYIFSMGQLQS
jgi:hypothetical protein